MTRLEKDSFGTIAVAVDRLWGAQTQRSLEHFAISTERMPEDKALAIMAAAGEVAVGLHTDQFPLSLGQEFSGFVAQLQHAEAVIVAALPSLYSLAVGGTAIGTGLNTHPEFGTRVAAALVAGSGLPFFSAAAVLLQRSL